MVIQPQYQPVKLAASAFGVLSLTTLLAATIFTNTTTYADDEPTNTTDDVVTITVQSSCTLASEGNNHSGALTPTQYSEDIGTTKVTITCNDPEGFAVYAVGYGNNKWNNNKLTSTTDTISTADKGTTNDSHWYMKIFGASDGITVHNDFTSEKAVPGGDNESDEDGFTKVISYASTTGKPSSTSFNTTYGAYASASQTAGEYTGKVKYTLVNPHKSDGSNKPKSKDITFDEAFADASKTKYKGHYKMQDITSGICSAVSEGVTGTLIDSRDDNTYAVSKLADGNCWMTQNLRFTGTKLTPADSNVGIETTIAWGDLTSGASYDEARLHVPTADLVSTDGNKPMDTYSAEELGVWYNYAGASAMTITGDSDTNVATSSICPYGWTLPTDSQQSAIASYVSAYAPIYGGYILRGKLYLPTTYGFWWSATAKDASKRYRLTYSYESLRVNNNGDRVTGYYVRCVASQ